jgi:hypothetical protein
MISLLRPSVRGAFDDPAKDDIVDRSDHPMVEGFANLWRGKGDPSSPADRADFALEELAPWFGHVIIMDMLENGADFRYRLVGTAITEFLNRDYTGRTVMQSNYSGARDKVLETFYRPVREGRPVFRRGHVIWAVDKSWRSYQSVHCPVTAGGPDVAMTIGVLYFSADPVAAPPDAPRGRRD